MVEEKIFKQDIQGTIDISGNSKILTMTIF